MFENYLKAAQLIRERGMAAANDAALLVGTRATFTMLLVTLEGDDEQKITQLREAGLTAFADVAFERCVIYDEAGSPIWSIERNVHGQWEEGGTEGLHLGMFLQCSVTGIKQLFAGKPPYKELKEVMRRESRTYRAARLREIRARERKEGLK